MDHEFHALMTATQFRAARLSLGLTQRKLAEALGYSDVMSISRKERGLVPITRIDELAIANLRGLADLERRLDRLTRR